MNKGKIVGLILAALLLIAALGARQLETENSMRIIHPVLTLGLWALTAVDIVTYRKYKSQRQSVRAAELARVISLSVLSVLLGAASIVSLL